MHFGQIRVFMPLLIWFKMICIIRLIFQWNITNNGNFPKLEVDKTYFKWPFIDFDSNDLCFIFKWRKWYLNELCTSKYGGSKDAFVFIKYFSLFYNVLLLVVLFFADEITVIIMYDLILIWNIYKTVCLSRDFHFKPAYRN